MILGPKKMLIVSAISGILSWILIAVQPNSVLCLLMSRLCTGLGNGILLSNVYLANVSSSNFLGSFKMIEVGIHLMSERSNSTFTFFQLGSKGLGAVCIFIALHFLDDIIGLQGVSYIFVAFPALALFGLFFSRESLVFKEK